MLVKGATRVSYPGDFMLIPVQIGILGNQLGILACTICCDKEDPITVSLDKSAFYFSKPHTKE